MGSETVAYEGSNFATTLLSPASKKPLSLFGNGLLDTEMHYLQIKFYAIGVYVEPCVTEHLQAWKGKKAEEVVEDESFFTTFGDAPAEKLFKLVIIKEVKGTQVVTPLRSSVSEKLVDVDKYEDEEEEALDKLVDYFHKKSWLTQGTSMYFYWPKPSLCQISVFDPKGEESAIEKLSGGLEHTIENANVARGILKWITSENFSPSLLKSLATQLVAQL